MFSRVSQWTNNNSSIILHCWMWPIIMRLLWGEWSWTTHHANLMENWFGKTAVVYTFWRFLVSCLIRAAHVAVRSLIVIPENRKDNTIGFVRRAFLVFRRTCLLEARSKFLDPPSLSMCSGILTRKRDATKPSDYQVIRPKEAIFVQ